MPSTLILYAFAALAGWGVIAPAAAYTYAWLSTRAEERAACAVRVVAEVKRVADKLSADTETKVATAVAAALAVPPTPTTAPELAKLCDTDPNCRDRRTK